MTIKQKILKVLDQIGLLGPINRLPGYAAKIAVTQLSQQMAQARAEIVELRSESLAQKHSLACLFELIEQNEVFQDDLAQLKEKRRHSNPQEHFWRGAQGEAYAKRSEPPQGGYYQDIWTVVLDAAIGCSNALELGCNQGGQLRAIHALNPEIQLTGLEINDFAAAAARKLGYAEIIQGSILDFAPERQWDLVYTAGVLIHFDPVYLPDAYELIDKAAREYVFFYENYSETPININYQERVDLCWIRDFAQDFQNARPGWKVMIEDMIDPGINYPPHARRKWTLLKREDKVS